LILFISGLLDANLTAGHRKVPGNSIVLGSKHEK
jgi:hypothetical protein